MHMHTLRSGRPYRPPDADDGVGDAADESVGWRSRIKVREREESIAEKRERSPASSLCIDDA